MRFIIYTFDNALVVNFYKLNDLIVFNLNRFQKLTNHRKNVIFSRISINEIFLNIKIDEMINLKIFVLFFIY